MAELIVGVLFGFLVGVLFMMGKIANVNDDLPRKLGDDFKMWWNRYFRFKTKEEKLETLEREKEELEETISKLKE